MVDMVPSKDSHAQRLPFGAPTDLNGMLGVEMEVLAYRGRDNVRAPRDPHDRSLGPGWRKGGGELGVGGERLFAPVHPFFMPILSFPSPRWI